MRPAIVIDCEKQMYQDYMPLTMTHVTPGVPTNVPTNVPFVDNDQLYHSIDRGFDDGYDLPTTKNKLDIESLQLQDAIEKITLISDLSGA